MENVHAVVVGEVSEQHAKLCGLEMIQRALDERVGELGDEIGGQLRADGFQEEVAFLVVEILVKIRKVGVVDVLGGGKQGRAIGHVQRPKQFTHGVFFQFVRHARRVRGRVEAGKEKGAMCPIFDGRVMESADP